MPLPMPHDRVRQLAVAKKCEKGTALATARPGHRVGREYEASPRRNRAAQLHTPARPDDPLDLACLSVNAGSTKHGRMILRLGPN